MDSDKDAELKLNSEKKEKAYNTPVTTPMSN